MTTIKDAALYVYENYLKHEYTDTSNGAAWVYPTEKDIKRDPKLAQLPKTFRPNHGLAHSLRVMSYVRPVVEYLKHHGANPEGFNFTEDQIKKLELCALFSVSGRENDTGWAGNPERYMEFRRNSGEYFETYCRENNIFDSEEELQEYKRHLIEMGTPENKNPIHVVINMAHKLDLQRCFQTKNDHSKEAVVEYVNEHSALKNNKQMVELVQYAEGCLRATGNRIWSAFMLNDDGQVVFDEQGDPIYATAPKADWDYRYEPFYACNTDVDVCLDQLNKVQVPHFDKENKREALPSSQQVKEQFQTISNQIQNCEMAVRTINNNPYNIQDLRYEMNDWVDPQHSRYIRPWWKESKWIGDRKFYRDQITGKLLERPVADTRVPFEQQSPMTQAPSLSHYWECDENGEPVLDQDGKAKPIVRPVDLNPDHMGQPKNTEFTKKRSFSLLRPDAKMKHFKGPAQSRNTFLPIGLGCDVNKLHQKGQRYIWLDDTRSSEKFWLGDKAKDESLFKSPRYPGRNHGLWLKDLQKMYKEQADHHAPADWYNEMMMGGHKDALNMLFSTENNLTHRLNLLFGSLRLKHEYDISLPLMIVDGEKPAAVYTREQMLTDLHFCAKNKDAISADDKLLFDKLVHSLCNSYRWENELTSLVDFNDPAVVKLMQATTFDGAALDDASRQKAGKSVLSPEHKISELMKKHQISNLVTKPEAQAKLADMVYDRLGSVNQALETKDLAEVKGLEAAETVLPNLKSGHTPMSYATEVQDGHLVDRLKQMQPEPTAEEQVPAPSVPLPKPKAQPKPAVTFAAPKQENLAQKIMHEVGLFFMRYHVMQQQKHDVQVKVHAGIQMPQFQAKISVW